MADAILPSYTVLLNRHLERLDAVQPILARLKTLVEKPSPDCLDSASINAQLFGIIDSLDDLNRFIQLQRKTMKDLKVGTRVWSQ